MTENTCSIKDNVERVKYDVFEICSKLGRNPEDIQIMGVSKTKSIDEIEQAIKAGITLFGENKVQELVQKTELFKKYNLPCHLIGSLQTNKVKYLPPLTNYIQSVDSIKLAKEIDKQYQKNNSVANILIEVNIGDEETKGGIDISNTFEIIHELSEYKSLAIKGLMCIPPICEGDKVRHYFAQMYKLFIDIQSKNVDNVSMDILSMGMSSDYRYALMEGSNLIRVGQGIFGKRNYNI